MLCESTFVLDLSLIFLLIGFTRVQKRTKPMLYSDLLLFVGEIQNIVAAESGGINHTCLYSNKLTLGGCPASGRMKMFAYLLTKYVPKNSFLIYKTVT